MNGVDTTRSDGTTRCVQIACAVSNNDNTRTALSTCAACFTRTSATTSCIGAARSTTSRITGRTFTTTTRRSLDHDGIPNVFGNINGFLRRFNRIVVAWNRINLGFVR